MREFNCAVIRICYQYRTGHFPQVRPTAASCQAIILRLAALFSFQECDTIMVWLLALPIICLAAAVFMWRFERYLGQLTGPWIISD
jgi:hypothetical protein